MQCPIDVLRSRQADPSFAATFMFSFVALLIHILVYVMVWMFIQCMRGKCEGNFSEGENKHQRGGQRCSSLGILLDATCDSDQ